MFFFAVPIFIISYIFSQFKYLLHSYVRLSICRVVKVRGRSKYNVFRLEAYNVYKAKTTKNVRDPRSQDPAF